MRASLTVVLAVGATGTSAALAANPPPGEPGVGVVRALGPHAIRAFAPRGAPGMGALVRLPAGVGAGDLGLSPAAPGIARFWGQPAALLAFADSHPGLRVEVTPPLHPLLDRALAFVDGTGASALGLDGTGVAVGLADTGLDVTHGDFVDAQGHSRVAWLLDLSVPPRGVHSDLEAMFGSTDEKGALVAGAVWSGDEIDQGMAIGATSSLPQDPAGHGTLVASCAAGNGENGRSKYRGVAPGATLLVARITDAAEATIGNDELLRGVAFLMNRADALAVPVVVNLSIGTDFGPHDGTSAWEETLASYVGPTHPGRAIVVAAGNSGSIAQALHQNVHVSSGTTMRVPILTQGAQSDGGVQVWLAIHGDGSLKVGLEKPGGQTWVDAVAPGQAAGSSDGKAGVDNGSQPAGSMVPAASNGAIVAWQGAWPSGTYDITLDGTATVDLYVQATGDAAIPGVTQVSFAEGVREGTIGLPATHPALIGVGCTINKPAWKDISGFAIGVPVPVLDAQGGELDPSGAQRPAVGGEPCWFSGAGPTRTGAFKPDIMAPGAAIAGALSAQAASGAESIFTSASCPVVNGRISDPTCEQIDATHAIALGTSFSSPIVAGTVAVMLQHDPLLTQDAILAALQGGAHPVRGPAPFADQAGPGEVDVLGAIAAVDRLLSPQAALPVRAASWLALGQAFYFADGSTPIDALVELRTSPDATGLALPADGFATGRLAAYAQVDGAAVSGVAAPVRRGPGVWTLHVQPPAGLGGSTLTVGARLDGVDIVAPVSVPIGTDAWSALYPSSLRGGCSTGGAPSAPGGSTYACAAAGALLLERRRVNRRKARRLAP